MGSQAKIQTTEAQVKIKDTTIFYKSLHITINQRIKSGSINTRFMLKQESISIIKVESCREVW